MHGIGVWHVEDTDREMHAHAIVKCLPSSQTATATGRDQATTAYQCVEANTSWAHRIWRMLQIGNRKSTVYKKGEL